MAPSRVALGWLFLGAGVLAGAILIVMVARAPATIERFAVPAAPALDLEAGRYTLVTSAPAALVFDVYSLQTRERLALTLEPDGATAFEVPRDGVYVVAVSAPEAAEGAAPPPDLEGVREVEVVAPAGFRLSLRLLLALAIAPIAVMPGALALALTHESKDGDTPGLPRRLAALAIDSVVVLLMLLMLLGASPLFRAVAGLIPLAPVAYAWGTAARGQGIGGWLLLVRTVDIDGAPPGALVGLVRVIVAAASWGALGLGYALAVQDRSQRTWHDRFTGTRVVAA